MKTDLPLTLTTLTPKIVNPWRVKIAKRLARNGGQYAKSTVATDRSIQREQDAIDMLREAIELRNEPGAHAPF